MALTDLIPWGRNRPLTAAPFGEEGDPFATLQRDIRPEAQSQVKRIPITSA